MELNFFESSDVPQPRANVKITKLIATPYPDGWRVRIALDVTPFQERPNLEVAVHAADGRSIADLSIIETMHHAMEFTIHIRGQASPAGTYRVSAALYYDDLANIQDRAEIDFRIEA